MTDIFRDEIEREYVIEREGWAPERIARVTERLQHGIVDDAKLESLVVWLADHTAFTTLGRTIYVSRRLLERLPDDDAAAFVVAHELAHHRLGHVPKTTLTSMLSVSLGLALLNKIMCSIAREADADRLAIELCMAAGYAPERCLGAFEILRIVSFDYGDVNGVLGGGRRRSHPALDARIAAVRDHVSSLRSGARPAVAPSIERDRPRPRDRISAAVADAADVAAGILGLRRLPRT